jgi:hypothetical protein
MKKTITFIPMELSKLVYKLNNRLQYDLPGKEIQRRMLVKINKFINFENSEENAIPSAVLILLMKKMEISASAY